MTTQKKFKGDTIGKIWYFKDEVGTLIDPDTITIKIYDPKDALKDTLYKSDLTKTATGTYKMKWNIPSDAEDGLWTIKVTGTAAPDIQNTEPFVFNVQK